MIKRSICIIHISDHFVGELLSQMDRFKVMTIGILFSYASNKSLSIKLKNIWTYFNQRFIIEIAWKDQNCIRSL